MIAMMVLLPVRMLVAQSAAEDDLASLVGIVKMLRTQNEANYGRAAQMLGGNACWTPMTEINRLQEGECRPADNVPGFKLNRLLSKVDADRKYVSTHGDMLNGEDERYNYSLYERAVKSGAEVIYTLQGREGEQVFVIVPFVGEKSGLSASLEIEGYEPAAFSETDGTLRAECRSVRLTRDQKVRIVVKNGSDSDRSFVLINHNTRKR